MSSKILSEAFSALNILEEETFDFNMDGAEKLKSFLDGDIEIEKETVIDPEAYTEEDLKDSYLGKVLLSCDVCHTLMYKDPEEVVIDEESDLANVGEECLYCTSTDGFKVVGQIEDYEESSDDEEVETDDSTDTESEETLDDIEFEDEEVEDEKVEIEESVGSWVAAKRLQHMDKKAAKSGKPEDPDELKKWNQKRQGLRTLAKAGAEDKDGKKNATAKVLDTVDADMKALNQKKATAAAQAKRHAENKAKLIQKLGLKDEAALKALLKKSGINVQEALKEAKIKDADEYTDEEIYDAVYGKLTCDGELYTKDREGNKTTVRCNNGLDYTLEQIVTDTNSKGIDCIAVKANSPEELQKAIDMADYYEIEYEIKSNNNADAYKYTLLIDYGSGNIEKIMGESDKLGYGYSAEPVNEAFERVDIETEDQKLLMTQDNDGRVTVTTEPKKEEIEAEGEVIMPVSDELKDTIETNSEELSDEEEVIDDAETDIEIDEFDEESFDELGESYLKRIYENVESFKTCNGKITDTELMLEGIITFKSGKKAKTNFTFESRSATKRGKVKLVGSNKQLSEGKKAFTITGNVTNKKLITESFTYNYKATDAKTGKSTRLYGTVRK